MRPVPGEPSSVPAAVQRRPRASFRLLRAFGTDVFVHGSAAAVPLLLFAAFLGAFPPQEAAAWTAAWTLAIGAVAWTHEMAHVWAARHLGIACGEITLWPLGAIAHLSRPAPNARGEIFVSLAGPLAHAFWFVAAGAPYLFFVLNSDASASTGAGMLRAFTALQVALLVLNLLPFWPMDGGAVTRALFAQRMHPNRASVLAAYVGFAGAAVTGLVGFALLLQTIEPVAGPAVGRGSFAAAAGPLLVGIGVAGAFACRRLILDSRRSEGPYASAGDPMSGGVAPADWAPDEVPEPAVARVERSAERRERRGGAERPRETDDRGRLEARIDALLDRINEVGGVEHLSEAERRDLADASASLRRARP